MPDAPAAAPTSAPAEHTDALSWMNDDANFAADSPAAQQVYDLPPDDGRPRAAPLAPEQPDREVLGKEEVKPGEKTAREALTEQLTGKDAEGEPGYTQDETGRWHRPDGAFADAKEVEAIETVLAEGKEGAKPDGAAAQADKPEKTATKSKQPIGDVQVYDKDGNVVAELPELAITYAADGKKLEKIPLDKLIRKAQLGEYNEQREQESLANRTKAEQSSARIADLEAAVAQYTRFFDQALDDEQFYLAARQQRALSQTPQAIAAQKDQEIAALRASYEGKEQQRQIDAYTSQHVAPRLNALVARLPNDPLVHSAFRGEVAHLTEHLKVNGKIPPQRFPEVVRLMDTVLDQWVDSVAQSRQTADDSEKKALRHQVEAAKVALTLAKKTQARAMKPQGASGSIRESPKPPPPPKSAEEANERMFEQIERDYGGGSR